MNSDEHAVPVQVLDIKRLAAELPPGPQTQNLARAVEDLIVLLARIGYVFPRGV
jgi:hypothetical protein